MKEIEIRVLERIRLALSCEGVGLYRYGEWQNLIGNDNRPLDEPPGYETFGTSLRGIKSYWCNIIVDAGQVFCWGFLEVNNSLIHSMIREMARALPEPDPLPEEEAEEEEDEE